MDGSRPTSTVQAATCSPIAATRPRDLPAQTHRSCTDACMPEAPSFPALRLLFTADTLSFDLPCWQSFFLVVYSRFLFRFSMSDCPQSQPVRRCATLPTKLRSRPRSSESLRRSEDDLFFHPCAKIVHFAPRAVAPIPSSTKPADFDYPVDTVETLPWRSPTERTVAFAPLRLQELQGLTVFLKCGSVVHAILKNSQCWCVDGKSTFVLRIRPLTYYRIEFPNETENNEQYVLELKTTLPKILRYEITPCPFQRGFTVEIPAEATVPRRKRAWRPKGRRESAPAGSSLFSAECQPKNGAEDTSSTAGSPNDRSPKKRSSCATLEAIPDDNEPRTTTNSGRLAPPKRSVTDTPQSFQNLLARFEDNTQSQADCDTSFSSSNDSFHSLEDSFTFPDSSVRSASTAPSSVDHTEQNDAQEPDTDYFSSKQSDSPSRSPSPCSKKPERSPSGVAPETSTAKALSSTGADLGTMSYEFRRRAKASTERELSPLPPASILFKPGSKTDTKSIIQKTCNVVLVPSVQLLLVLIHIAAHIVIGPAFNSYVDNKGRRIECRTDSLDSVDDFDLPLEPEQSSDSHSQTAKEVEFWKVD